MPTVPPPPEDDERSHDADADHEAVARKILLDQLTGRARSRTELSQKLSRRHVPDDVAARVLDRFEEVGLVDDAGFAREWVQARHSGRGLARRALAAELRRKGVSPELVDEAVQAVDPASEQEAARSLVRRKLPSMRRLDEATTARRLTAMLARKGYPPSVAYQVVREEVAGAEELVDGVE